MKRSKGLIPQMMEYDNLLLAFWKASKGKRHASAVLRYQQKLQDNLLILKEQIRTGCVEVGDYHHFMVYEPKPRNICASAFSEQVLHRGQHYRGYSAAQGTTAVGFHCSCQYRSISGKGIDKVRG